jgi:hypothetical protein
MVSNAIAVGAKVQVLAWEGANVVWDRLLAWCAIIAHLQRLELGYFAQRSRVQWFKVRNFCAVQVRKICSQGMREIRAFWI